MRLRTVWRKRGCMPEGAFLLAGRSKLGRYDPTAVILARFQEPIQASFNPFIPTIPCLNDKLQHGSVVVRHILSTDDPTNIPFFCLE
jgi:hypothetical protein